MKTATVVILIVTAAALIVWDVIAAAENVPGDTISEVLRNTATQHPILPFALGVIVGHLFWH